MDPKEILRLADQAISDCDHESAMWYLHAYNTWRERGGFQPIEVAGTLKRGDEFAKWCKGRLTDLIQQNK